MSLAFGSTWDVDIYNDVYLGDCYKLRDWKPIREPKFILDIGAQCGMFSKLAAELYPNVKVLSFEMIKENYVLAEEHRREFNNVILQ